MILLISGATKTIRELNRPDLIGHLITPGNGNAVPSNTWAADNQAFTGLDVPAFCRMLGKISGRPGCKFVACPDVVGNAHETAELFYAWRSVIKSLGLPIALVLQDGQEHVGVPWNFVDALFIGGSTGFKLGPVAARMAREAKRRGKWLHGGRVNTRQRFRYMHELGCDSVDGSGFSKWPEIRIPMGIRWLEEFDRQPSFLAA